MTKTPCVLLVDDDPITNFLNSKLLLRLGVTDNVRVAQNGVEALHELQDCQQQPDTCPVLIFLDVNMPVMGGFEFLEVYAQLPPKRRPDVVVVMLTTSGSARDRQRAARFPVAGFLSKPLTQQQVEQVMTKHFN